MSSAKAPKHPSNDSTGAVHNEAAPAHRQGESASYYDSTHSFETSMTEESSTPAAPTAFLGPVPNFQGPYGYTVNAGEAGETYTGTAPPISYQQTLADGPAVPAAPAEGYDGPASPPTRQSENNEHAGSGGLATDIHHEDAHVPSKPTTQREGHHVKPGTRGTIRGLVALARKKPHVHEDTAARVELLRRADKFFNEGFIGKYGMLDKKKTALFRQEIDRVEAKLAQM